MVDEAQQNEMQEIADGAYGDDPRTRGMARELIARTAGEWPPRDTIWRHKKRGSIYRIVGRAFIEATNEPAVIYQPLDGDVPWVRPRSEFMDGRFERIERPVPDCNHLWGDRVQGAKYCLHCGTKQ